MSNLNSNDTLDAILQVGSFSLPISANVPCTILLGGTSNGSKHPELIKADVLEVEFDKEKIQLPPGEICLASFPFPQLETTTITSNLVTYDLLMHVNGNITAASHWKSEGTWSQYGFLLPPYLGESDLIEIDPALPVSGKGLDVFLRQKEASPLPIIYIGSLNRIEEDFTSIKFPRWNDAILVSPLEITTRNAIYVLKGKVLSKGDCDLLIGKVTSAIESYTRDKEFETAQRLNEIELVHIRGYASRFRH